MFHSYADLDKTHMHTGLICDSGQGTPWWWWWVFSSFFLGGVILSIKQNYILKKFYLELIRERILASTVIGLMTVSTDGPSPTHSVLVQPEMWVCSKMFQLCQLCPGSTTKKVGPAQGGLGFLKLHRIRPSIPEKQPKTSESFWSYTSKSHPGLS